MNESSALLCWHQDTLRFLKQSIATSDSVPSSLITNCQNRPHLGVFRIGLIKERSVHGGAGGGGVLSLLFLAFASIAFEAESPRPVWG